MDLAARVDKLEQTVERLLRVERLKLTTTGGAYVNELNVGSASGAGAGEIFLSGDHIRGSSASAHLRFRVLSIANAGTAQLLEATNKQAFIFIEDNEDAFFAIYTAQAGGAATQEIADPSGKFTTVAGSASSANIYWSAGNSRYEIQNNLGATRTFSIFSFTNT